MICRRQMPWIWSCKKFCRLVKSEPLPKQGLVFTCLQYKPFENTKGRGEIAHNKQFLLSPQCFLSIWKTFLPLTSTLKLLSANSFNLEDSKICCLGKGWITMMIFHCTITLYNHFFTTLGSSCNTRSDTTGDERQTSPATEILRSLVGKGPWGT